MLVYIQQPNQIKSNNQAYILVLHKTRSKPTNRIILFKTYKYNNIHLMSKQTLNLERYINKNQKRELSQKYNSLYLINQYTLNLERYNNKNKNSNFNNNYMLSHTNPLKKPFYQRNFLINSQLQSQIKNCQNFSSQIQPYTYSTYKQSERYLQNLFILNVNFTTQSGSYNNNTVDSQQFEFLGTYQISSKNLNYREI
eukprot:TRINITY_DN9878_c0_g1_i8.p2 TRINITY_DN9878_c0_g1~~TRINITY_DN9878_c0_g1_i8.p2  ORF type:complete len:197 (+),score=-18.05 TRINITY_DN9878_c0_g1_i8:715-1305(+)